MENHLRHGLSRRTALTGNLNIDYRRGEAGFALGVNGLVSSNRKRRGRFQKSDLL
jgi:hypothetical protein